ncbi:MAG TPA: alpha/beta hydrolase-fold protein [Ferruginibacter sp.]|nr:alpha/beta hydrolase-fold protein [Ferruginibacter sp.]
MKQSHSNPMKKIFTYFFLTLLLMIVHASVFCQTNDPAATSLFVTKKIHSKILGEDRRINIYSPVKPNDSTHYPVLYVLDAEVMMSMVAGQVQYLSESYKIIPSMIIVGIENTDRTRDLTPTRSIIGPDGKPDTTANAFGKNSGGGEKLFQFMRDELMPYVEQNFPCAPYKILYGHSLGGLMAIHAMINHPGLFNSYIALSPSLQWDTETLLKQFETAKNNEHIKGFLFFSDANEGGAFHQNQLRLDSVLKQKNIKGLNYKYIYYPGETHISEPIKGFYDGLKHIYPNWFLPYNSSSFRKTMTAKMLYDQYEMLSAKYNYKVIPPQFEINQVSRMLRRDSAKINDAIGLLEMNVRNYPSSAVTYEILGDTYLLASDKPRALASFEKALSLNKENEALKQKINKLKN